MCPETGDGRPRDELVVWCGDCTHGRHDPKGCLGRRGRRIGACDTLKQAKVAGSVEILGHLHWEFTGRDGATGAIAYNSSDANF
jgi:hypothetical protein